MEVVIIMLVVLICGVIFLVVVVWFIGRILLGVLDLFGVVWWVFGVLVVGMFGGFLLGVVIYCCYYFDMRVI